MLSRKNPSYSLSIFLLIGLIVGASLAALHHHSVSASLPSFWIGLYGFMFLFASQNAISLKRLAISTLIPSLLASLPCAWFSDWNDFSFSILILIVTHVYALNAFHLNYQRNRFKLHYQTLFFGVWDTIIQLFIIAFFTLLCWVILELCASLFALLNITFLKSWMTHFWFNIWITSIFISIGLYIAIQTQAIVRTIRGILVLMCRYLFIPLAIMGILFLITSLITRHLSFDRAVFVSIAFLSSLFLNGLYEEGQKNNPYPPFLAWLCTTFIVITPVFTLFALNALIFHSINNISTNNINAYNFPYLLNVLILLAYNISYAIIALKRQTPWLKSIEKTNITLAILLIVLTTATTNPFFLSRLPNPKNYLPIPKQPTQQQLTTILTAEFNNSGLAWIKKNNQIPKEALILGYNKDPIYFCRGTVENTQRGGILIKNLSGTNICQIIYQKKIIESNDFTVLSGSPSKIIWADWMTLSNMNNRALLLPNSPSENAAGICRTIYDNHIVVGTAEKDNRCTFVSNHKIISANGMTQFLYINLLSR